MNYPSKKITWMIIAAAVVVIGAFAYAEYYSAQNAAENASGLSVDSSSATGTEIAAGDWQKTLLGVDPATAKTSAGSLTPKAAASSSPDLTETDRLGQALFTQYVQLEQAGLANDPNSINAAVTQILNGSAVYTAPKRYALSDLDITASIDQNSLRLYANALATLFQSYDGDQGKEIEYVQQGVGGGDPAALAKIDPIIKDYQSILSSLLVLPVPEAVATDHLLLTNAMSMILATAKLLRHSDVDPMAGLQAVAQYPAGIEALVNGFNKLSQDLNNASVRFSASDPGRVLLNQLPPPTLPAQTSTFTPQ